MRYIAFSSNKKPSYYKGILMKADLGLHEQIAQKVISLVPKGAKILDFGAGEGALSQRLSDLGYDIVAADINDADFKANVHFIKVDFNSREQVKSFIDMHQGVFDLVLGIEVIEHVHNPWDYVDDLLSMLKPHSHILITTPNITSWLSRIIFLFKGRYHQFSDEDLPYGHIAPITPWEIGLIFKQKNLSNIAIEPAGTLPPIYIERGWKLALVNALALCFRPFMRGIIDGWCIMASARRDE